MHGEEAHKEQNEANTDCWCLGSRSAPRKQHTMDSKQCVVEVEVKMEVIVRWNSCYV